MQTIRFETWKKDLSFMIDDAVNTYVLQSLKPSTYFIYNSIEKLTILKIKTTGSISETNLGEF